MLACVTFCAAQFVLLFVLFLAVTPSTGTSYYFYADGLSWEDSKMSCESTGMQLVAIKQTAEITEFTNFLITQGNDADARIWMGLHIPEWSESEGDFHWVDGSAMTVTDWDSDEPNNLDRMKCVLIQADSDDKWNTRPCSEKHPYVCQLADGPTAIRRFAQFQRVPHDPGTCKPSISAETIPHSANSLISCARRCLDYTRCHMITWTQSACAIVLDSATVPCYCEAVNCTAYERYVTSETKN